MSGVGVFDARRCGLGEGPLWHPSRGLIWFDVAAGALMASDGEGQSGWALGEMASAAGLTEDPDRLLVATESAPIALHLGTGAREEVCALEADRPGTRSNDGRADPWGDFWIGTMGKRAEARAGAIHRWREGALVALHEAVTIPDAICFDRDRARAFFADTRDRVIRRQALHPDTGWPEGEAEAHIDLRAEGIDPDGAVIDAEGNLWNARWGAGRVACHDPEGRVIRAVGLPARHVTCPAFGGPGLSTLYCTSALQGLDEPDEAQGRTHRIEGVGRGAPEPTVCL